MNNNSTYLNILISKFNKTVDEIKDKSKELDELEEFLRDEIVSPNNALKRDRNFLNRDIENLSIRRDTLKEIITDMKEYELCQKH